MLLAKFGGELARDVTFQQGPMGGGNRAGGGVGAVSDHRGYSGRPHRYPGPLKPSGKQTGPEG